MADSYDKKLDGRQRISSYKIFKLACESKVWVNVSRGDGRAAESGADVSYIILPTGGTEAVTPPQATLSPF